MKPVTVKSGSVVLTVKPWKHPSGLDYWRASYHCPISHKRRTITRATLADAKEAAFQQAQAISRGTLDLSLLSPHQTSAIRRMIEADPTLGLVDEFLAWKARAKPEKPCKVAVAEFLAAKRSAAGASRRNVDSVEYHLALLPEMPVGNITPADLPPLTGAPRSRVNRRRAWVTFFRWCVRMEYLPHGEPTAPERLEKPQVVSKVPVTLTPEELRILLDSVSPEYMPWLACAAFAGIRNSEMSPVGSDKPPLDWSDFKWDRNLIVLRPETAKTGRGRIIPILPVLAAWLRPVAQKAGRVCPERNPTRTKGKTLAESARIGKLIGGWKPNALRHSFISYRAAMVGIKDAAAEAGNSESISRAVYQDAKGKDEAERWFGISPKQNRLRAI